MNKKFIAIAAAMMVLTGSMAFAASTMSNTQMPMQQRQYMQHNGYNGQMSMQHNSQMPMRHNGQHMYQLSDKAKSNSTSMWGSMCNFFGMRGSHSRHGGHMSW